MLQHVIILDCLGSIGSGRKQIGHSRSSCCLAAYTKFYHAAQSIFSYTVFYTAADDSSDSQRCNIVRVCRRIFSIQRRQCRRMHSTLFLPSQLHSLSVILQSTTTLRDNYFIVCHLLLFLLSSLMLPIVLRIPAICHTKKCGVFHENFAREGREDTFGTKTGPLLTEKDLSTGFGTGRLSTGSSTKVRTHIRFTINKKNEPTLKCRTQKMAWQRNNSSSRKTHPCIDNSRGN